MKPINDVSILVVGDIMLDKYIYGHVRRVSQEAPVPVLDADHISRSLGGCGNVVANLSAMGVDAKCVAAVGVDNNGERVRDMLDALGVDYYLYQEDHTTIKTRLIALPDNLQVARYDCDMVYQNDKSFPLKNLDMFDAVIISDYGKGMVSQSLTEDIVDLHDGVLIDPFPANWLAYKNAFMLTPNDEEFVAIGELAAYSPYSLYDNVLRKRGKRGMTLCCNGNREHIDSTPVPVFNVCGAGDTVIAAMAACISMGLTIYQSAQAAQRCAEYVVSQPGTACVPEQTFQGYVNEIQKTH